MAFGPLAQPAAYSALMSAVNADPDGKPRILAPWEEACESGQDFDLTGAWEADFVREWLSLPPTLADVDLRGALYVGREHAPLLTAADRLSSEAASVLTALLTTPAEADALKDEIGTIPRPEIAIIMERLLAKARQEQAWGAPPILQACITVVSVDHTQGSTLAGFLIERPASQIQPSIVPKIADSDWADVVLDHWAKDPGVAGPVKAAITRGRTRGNIAK